MEFKENDLHVDVPKFNKIGSAISTAMPREGEKPSLDIENLKISKAQSLDNETKKEVENPEIDSAASTSSSKKILKTNSMTSS